MNMNQYGQPKSPEELDIFLEHGWFRTGLYVFTCDFIDFEHIFYRTIWLRHDLKAFEPGKTWKKLSKRNSRFNVVFSEAVVTPAQEYLFRIYREAMTFEPAKDLHQLLFDGRVSRKSPFNTHQLCVYDQNELIGCSYFDLGAHSVAGISAFYHPDYTLHSLGIFMIYSQIIYSQQKGFRYYYPGYFIPHYSHFDYKLRIGQSSLTFFHPEERTWLAMNQYEDLPIPFASY